MVTVRLAYRRAITATRQDLVDDLRGAYEPAALHLLRGVIAQYSGDVARAMSLLRRAVEEAGPGDAAYAADVLGPIYVMVEDRDALRDLLEDVLPNGEVELGFCALRAIHAAMRGELAESRVLQHSCEASAGNLDDAMDRARVYQRLSLAAYRSGDALDAARLAALSANLLIGIRAYRSAAAAISVAYNVHHAVTMDTERALECAVRMTQLGELSEDESFAFGSLAAQYEIFAELGREDDLARTRATLRRRSLPEQYRERFATGLADVLPLGWRADFAALRASMILLHDAGAKTRGERAMCLAVRALAEAGAGEVDACRRVARSALFLCDHRSLVGLAPYDLRYLRIARGLAGAACILVGDGSRGRRVFRSGSTLEWQDLPACERAADGIPVPEANRIRGYLMLIDAARRALAGRAPPLELTPGEMLVLRLLADGLSAPQIALETKRSVHTVRAHTRSIISKLGVHGRYAAVRAARQIGVLPNEGT